MNETACDLKLQIMSDPTTAEMMSRGFLKPTISCHSPQETFELLVHNELEMPNRLQIEGCTQATEVPRPGLRP